MSHNNNNIITAPVDFVSDIAYVLGSAAADTGDLGRMIANGNINKWAKYKPVKYSTVGLTGKNKAPSSTWWHGYNEQCGLAIPSKSDLGSPGTSGSFFYKLLNSQLMWTYDRPSGGLTYPYRALDFDGYDPGATEPMTPLTISSMMISSGGELAIQFEEPVAYDGDAITLSDIKVGGTALSSWYFGVLVYYSASQYTFAAPATIAANGLNVTLTGMAAYVGKTVQIVPFLSKVQITQDTAVANQTFISFNLAPASVNLVQSSAGIDVYFDVCEWNAAGTAVNYTIRLVNATSLAKTIENIVITFWEDSSTTGTGHTVRTIASQAIAANGEVSLMGTYSFTYDQSRDFFLSIMTQGNNVIPFTDNYIEESAASIE